MGWEWAVTMSVLVKIRAVIDGCDGGLAEDASCRGGGEVNVKDVIAMEGGVMIILVAVNLAEEYLLVAVGPFISCFWLIYLTVFFICIS